VRSLAAVLAATALLTGCAANDDSTDNPSTPSDPGGSACGGGAVVSGTVNLTTTRVAQGLASPVDLQSPAGDCRMFVVEQGGRIRILRNGAITSTPFLDITARLSSGGERGLLGLAFHPRYAENGRFFVNYTNRNGDTHIAEFRANPASSDTADAGSEKLILFVSQPFSNHNGGGLAFGPEGFLYIGLGDGGSGGDPQGNGQSLGTHLGKMLRIDVDSGSPYGVPRDNPFIGRSGARGEIWAYGLRNPWRFAFDRTNGNLVIADVGQNAVEEIDLGLRSGGENFGWNVTEGNDCFRPSSGCSRNGLTMPMVVYGHGSGACSVTGGVVYRGRRMPFLHGTYFYSDYCQPFVRSFRIENLGAVDQRDRTGELGRGLNRVSAFGTDSDGEAYIIDHDGEIYRIDPVG
jgi:glucose/arabinose dehydrogenase